jgi:hypothetical protein
MVELETLLATAEQKYPVVFGFRNKINIAGGSVSSDPRSWGSRQS